MIFVTKFCALSPFQNGIDVMYHATWHMIAKSLFYFILAIVISLGTIVNYEPIRFGDDKCLCFDPLSYAAIVFPAH